MTYGKTALPDARRFRQRGSLLPRKACARARVLSLSNPALEAPGDGRQAVARSIFIAAKEASGAMVHKYLRNAFIVLIIIAIVFALTEVAEYYLEIVRQN